MRTSLQPVARTAGGTRCEPSRRLLVPAEGFVYTRAEWTNLSQRFAAQREEVARRRAWQAATQQVLRLEYAQPAAARCFLLEQPNP